MLEITLDPPGGDCMKRYDQSYFDRWYRRSRVGIGHRDFVERKVRLALSAAEYTLARKVRSVLDVGCGEAPWRAVLKRLRPGLRYDGIDGSEYAVKRYGKRRNIQLGRFGDLGFMSLKGPYDLVVCSDVLHYVRGPELRRGLAALAVHVDGVAFIEAFTSADAIEGDHVEFQQRSPGAYAKLFEEAGLVPLGLHLYTTRERFSELTALERGGARA